MSRRAAGVALHVNICCAICTCFDGLGRRLAGWLAFYCVHTIARSLPFRIVLQDKFCVSLTNPAGWLSSSVPAALVMVL